MVRRTKADALTTRLELLDAAERLFSERGVSNTSMMQVAEAAGVTRGAIYHHFENKLALIYALMERVSLPVDEMRDALRKEHINQPLLQLRERCLHIVHQVQNDPHMQALVNILCHKCEYVEDTLPIHLRHLSGRNECIDECVKLIELAQQQGSVREDIDPRLTIISIFALIDGLFYNWLLDPEYFDLMSAAGSGVDNYLQGISKV
ncbi:HTH-type transcriptional regulator TtgR [Pseudidiomarina piscicola]|uniref:HTH-type transcriptional regulator TtgR n=1 Tax=Pseudidiomarina piscicola TaxID=2614830 RepID=A0A6S6WS56_9GAMM|nr:TetR family transcriptional regulator [Pseudidiomarina piscicola]CAB0151414.1 HTH-type transcriptional regulator TtgR [Pseudidiomarina piscicola]VZT40894.1 HTH-type transcriptional regulator TtgR [Pseudomonas aeruginosa]